MPPTIPTASDPAERGASTKALLKLTWDYPVWQAPEAPRSEGTSVKAPRAALSREAALKFLAGTDPRPLLVLRECSVCNKTDDALLTPGTDNERTLFLTRWFHCVKLPVDVIQPDHPFNALFPDKESEHLFVSAVDGSGKLPLESNTSRVELWSAMSEVLGAAYTKDPGTIYKDVQITLEKLDVLDARLIEQEASLGELMEGSSPDPLRANKLKAGIELSKTEIAARRADVERWCKIELKTGGGSARGAARANQ